MAMTDTKTPLNLQLIGGEMFTWSDRDPARGRPPVRGEVLAPVLAAAVRPGGRVLLAGPHDPSLVDILIQRGVDLVHLVRSYPDAQELVERYQRETAVTICCGGLEKLAPEPPFDTIIALDDLGRLSSVEGADLTWGEAFDLLMAALRAGGTLLLGVENFLGLHRLVDLPSAYADVSDAAWAPVGEFDPSRPGGLAATTDRLRAAELAVAGVYAAYPTPEAPTVLLAPEVLHGDAALHGYLDGTLATASRQGFAGRTVLSDPRRLASTALRSAAAADIAPMWIFMATRNDAAPRASQLPAVLVADGGQHDPWHALYEIRRDHDGRWARHVLSAATATAVATSVPGADQAGTPNVEVVTRVPEQLTGALAAGRTLEEHLLTLCMRRDLPGLRELLTAYHGWLADQEIDGALPGRFVFATVENVIIGEDGSLGLLDSSWQSTLTLSAEVALARALRRFAVELLVGGFAHPWPSSLDANALTVTLTAMAGLDVDRAVVEDAVTAEVALVAAVRGLDTYERRQLATEIATMATGSRSPEVHSYRELREAATRLEQELISAQAKLVWYEEMLSSRESALRRAQRTIKLMNSSVSFRVGRLLIAPARFAKRVLRSGVRRIRPR